MTIRLGVVGCGSRANKMIQRLRAEAPDLRVTAVVDPDEPSARARLGEPDGKEAVFFPTLPELVKKGKPDALLIGTMCNLHAPFAIQAAKFDLPLFLEKPVATSLKQACALEAAFRKSRCRVVVSFPLRVSPLCALALDRMAGGAVGRPEHVHAVNYVPYGTTYFDKGPGYHQLIQGLFIQKATHDFDYLSVLMGAPIVRVAARASLGRVFGGKKPSGLRCSRCAETETCLESPANRKRNGSSVQTNDHGCLFSVDVGTPETGMNEDCSSALLEFASGAHGVYSQVFFARRDAASRGAIVSGYQGTLSFDWYRNELKLVRHHAPVTEILRVGEGLSHFGGDQELARDFLALIRGAKRSRTPIETGLQSIYACLAARQSARTGRFVEVRQVGF